MTIGAVSGLNSSRNNVNSYTKMTTKPCTTIKKSAFPSFGMHTSAELKKIRVSSGIPEYVSSAFDGYTGPKLVTFPISNTLKIFNYPNIEKEFNKLKEEILDELKGCGRLSWLNPKILLKFLKKFPTGEPWDTKYLPELPGRDKKGNTQYALYKGKVVSANYLSNNLYAQICAAIKLPLSISKLAAKIDACGLSDPLSKGKIPTKASLMFSDTPQDQDAIVSGYHDFLHNNPWFKEFDPSRPHPKV